MLHGAVYHLSSKAKAIVSGFHKTLAREQKIPQQAFFNPLLDKNANAYQKATRKVMKEIRVAIQKRDGF